MEGNLDDEVVVAWCTADKLKLAGGFRYRRARRPELYGAILQKGHNASLNRVDEFKVITGQSSGS